MKSPLLLLLFLASTSGAAQTVEWAYSLGSDLGGEWGRVIKQDAAGNTYIGGRLFSMADFDLTNSFYFLSPANYHSGYIAKYEPNMQLLWAKDIGGPDYQDVYDIIIDDNDNVLVTGSFKQSIKLDAVTTLQSNGASDIFIAKYSGNGQLLWAHGFGSPFEDRGNALSIDIAGNIYIAGYYSGTIDIDPGNGVTNMYNAGSFDGFAAKFTPQGDFIRRLYIGGLGAEEVNGIGTDSVGNVYLTGNFHNGADFIVGTADHILNTGNIDIFIAKYDSTLQFEWAYDVGGGLQFGSNCQAQDIEVSPSGDFAIGGIFWGTAQFDPIGGGTLVTPNAGDMYVARYGPDATFHWMQHVGLHQGATAFDLDMDDAGNYYAAGGFYDSLDFDPGPGVDMRVTHGWRDPCVWSLDASGNYRWTLTLGSSGQEDAFGIHVSNDSTFLITGNIDGTADFNPNGPAYTVGSSGISDIFIAKYKMNPGGVTGIEESVQNELTIYPNPSTGNVYLNFPRQWNGPMDIRMYDSMGRLCYLDRMAANRPAMINGSNLPRGVYMVQAFSSSSEHLRTRLVLE